MSKQYETNTITKDYAHPTKSIYYWTFTRYGILDQKITVVVRQRDGGRKEFYSIFT